MEMPWSKLFWWDYTRGLDNQFPAETRYLDLEYLPTGWTWWFGGFSWNFNWYKSLVNHVHFPDPDQLVQVEDRKDLPASFNFIDCSGLESVRRINVGLRALAANVPKVRVYKEMAVIEDKCLELCASANRIMNQGEIEMVCGSTCFLGRMQAEQDLKGEMRRWKETAVDCMKKHSVAHGDGNQAEFDQCSQVYADEVVGHATNEESLNTWLSQYKQAKIDSPVLDISKTMNRPA